MNVSEKTLLELRELYQFSLYDENLNEVDKEKATDLYISFDKNFETYLGKFIKATKKEMTLEHILFKINDSVTYRNLSTTFNKLIKDKITAYPTTYGIGIFVAISFRSEIEEIRKEIEKRLAELNIEYTNEYSSAGWVFRYKISKSKENLYKLNSL